MRSQMCDFLVCRYYNNDWNTYPDFYRQFLANFFLAQIDGFETGWLSGFTQKKTH